MTNKTYAVKFRRRREGKTNYSLRRKLLTSGTVRLVVRKSLSQICVQLVSYTPQGDKVHASVTSKHLLKHGWKGSTKNIPAAYLTGYLLGKQAKVKEAIFDAGLHTLIPGNNMYAVVKGAIDAGLQIPCSEDVFPKEERLQGKHIKDFDSAQIEAVKKNIDK